MPVSKINLCFIIIIALFALSGLSAQESLDWDIDSIFDEPDLSEPEQGKPEAKPAQVKIKKTGYTFGLDFRFITGIAPGWFEMPGTSDFNRDDYFLDRYITMKSIFTLDAQISEEFRVMSKINFEIPGSVFKIGDFFFDYSLYDTVFFRGGKYNMSWGISPNYHFTNLLIRVPEDAPNGDSYIFKADVPVGNGGFQALTMTRTNLNKVNLPKLSDFGFGIKYNYAQSFADIDLGFFYQEAMPARGILSIKKTINKIELYNEWLGSINMENNDINGSVNIGFAADFFKKILSINGELLYNGERDTYWYQQETDIRDAEKYPFINGLNIALNLQYKPWSKGNPRLFLQTRYAPMENSAQVIPGFRLTPWKYVDFYFSLPMALGDKGGYYYDHTVNKSETGNPLPFAILFMVRIGGGVSFGHYN